MREMLLFWFMCACIYLVARSFGSVELAVKWVAFYCASIAVWMMFNGRHNG